MVKTKTELKKIANDYVKRLRNQRIRVEKVILFGSYGRGTPRDDSDIDLAFISEDFDRYNLLERQRILANCRQGFTPTDVVAYSPAMLNKKKRSSTLIQQILADGVTLFAL
jgi:predicted nucleotidyltransferase